VSVLLVLLGVVAYFGVSVLAARMFIRYAVVGAPTDDDYLTAGLLAPFWPIVGLVAPLWAIGWAIGELARGRDT
jgi:hypothetical protein